MAIKKLGTKLAIAISIGALNCQNAFAWSDTGHQIIAALAWSYMTPAAPVSYTHLDVYKRQRLF